MRPSNLAKQLTTVLAFVCLWLCRSTAAADFVVDTETKLLASDAAANSVFGSSVAISGNTAAIWSLDPQKNPSPVFSTGTPAIYVFQRQGANWVQVQKLQPLGGAQTPSLTGFPNVVALDNDLMVVGAPSFNPVDNSAYIFARIGGVWLQQAVLDGGTPLTSFGISVDISGQTAVVGAPTYDLPAVMNAGAAFVYVQQGTNWVQQALLTAPDALVQELMGVSVAISGDTIMAGAERFDSSGEVYVFVRNGTNWLFQQKLRASDAAPLAEFGRPVDLDGDIAVIGAPHATVAGQANCGAAYIFVRNGTSWTQQQKLVPSDPAPDLLFGTSVSISDSRVVIGAPGKTVDGKTNSGASYTFELSGTNWLLVQEVTASDVGAGDRFGQSVNVGQLDFIVGSPLNDQAGSNAGAAYIYTQTVPPLTITNATATPSVLFPPNHKLVPVRLSIGAQRDDVSCRIVSVSSNEPVNGRGDGNTSPDWIITGDLTLLLRAERSGPNKAGRIYTITVQCTDTLGNTITTTVLVTVPHDNGNK